MRLYYLLDDNYRTMVWNGDSRNRDVEIDLIGSLHDIEYALSYYRDMYPSYGEFFILVDAETHEELYVYEVLYEEQENYETREMMRNVMFYMKGII